EPVGALLRSLLADGLLPIRLLVGRGVLGGALRVGAGLLALGLGARGGRLLSGLPVGLADLLGGFFALGVGDRLVGDGFLAVAGLGLLELSLLHQIVLAGHGAGHLLDLPGDVVQQ